MGGCWKAGGQRVRACVRVCERVCVKPSLTPCYGQTAGALTLLLQLWVILAVGSTTKHCCIFSLVYLWKTIRAPHAVCGPGSG